MAMRFSIIAVIGCIVLGSVVPQHGYAQDKAGIEIAYEKFVLDNGLTLIVHEDRKAPIVAVNLWYHVGSKNEVAGKTGFAHLFEHLMFQGSENFNDEYFIPFERVGATDMNGTTGFDRTNYFQNVPSTAIDTALWMESDRMGHLLGAIDQERLDEQRGVVQNEKRQRENQPYGKVFGAIVKNLFPTDHPYSWLPIGSMEDLNAASLEDVQTWFKTYYGPNNAVIVVAGDIDPPTALAKVQKYFGDIPPGPPLTRHETWVPKLSEPRRQVMEDRVPQARIYKSWIAPQLDSADSDYLDLASSILAGGKNSRLYKRLVYDDQIATDVGAFVQANEIAGFFTVSATVQPQADPTNLDAALAEVEQAVDEEINRFLARGPTRKELQRVQTQFRGGFIRGVERIGGFGGKSDILASNEVYGGSPDGYKGTVRRVSQATVRDITDAARDWLGDGVYILEVRPFAELSAAADAADRSGVPEPDSFPSVAFPQFERATLDNGLKIVVAQRTTVPNVWFRLLLDAGYAADQFGLPGTAGMALSMLDEGTATRTALEISEELAQLAANVGAGSNLDHSSVSLSSLKENLDASLDVFADIVLNPSFPENELARLKRLRLAAIQREKVTPFSMALRVFPRLLYGEGHAYGLPFTGSGTEQSVKAIDRTALIAFHETWFRPNNATMVIVGDTTLDEIKPRLEALFQNWAPGEVPTKNIATVTLPESPSLYLVDRPGSQQSIIFAGHVAPPKANPQEIAIEAMNDVLGGSFTSRINMNLREDKNWAYGASSVVVNAKGQRPFLAYAPVQSDKTSESLAEILKELEGIVGANPATEAEIVKVKNYNTLTLPGRWETARAIGGSIAEIVRFGLADDYWDTYAQQVRALSVDDVVGATRSVIFPGKLVWVVVGDREQIEPGLRELGFDDIRLIDADGNPVSDRTAALK